ncbi:MAG TPA: YebC/PmpR family DNA-binding transcriptional regulator [Myxococcales bacterium LLY-WYZ-16_1]|jgi:YebC/PmpR family DNA-binding regulatory protein|nr:YebC/PmpR family DNA-binding transcriptional regulator [Myxococcales bacterium LLY-WYZ-16_1]
MGRTFENRKHAMAKRGDRDAKAFTRAGRLISMAVKAGGPDPDANPALRRAVQNARAVNMPKDRIQAAIDKASGAGDGESYEEILYEGYGPFGVAILVETATDNPTRTVANVRAAFKKENGNLGTTGSVSFMFDRFGVFQVQPEAIEGIGKDELELELIDHGLEEMFEDTDDRDRPVWVIRCAREGFGALQAALEAKGIEPRSSGMEWIPKTTTPIDQAQAEEIRSLVDRLEQDDDVQKVFTNAEVS